MATYTTELDLTPSPQITLYTPGCGTTHIRTELHFNAGGFLSPVGAAGTTTNWLRYGVMPCDADYNDNFGHFW